MAEVSAASSLTAAEGGEIGEGKGNADGKLSLRMKLVTPVEEVNSERFSLQSEQLLAYLVLHAYSVALALVTSACLCCFCSLCQNPPSPRRVEPMSRRLLSLEQG